MISQMILDYYNTLIFENYYIITPIQNIGNKNPMFDSPKYLQILINSTSFDNIISKMFFN